MSHIYYIYTTFAVHQPYNIYNTENVCVRIDVQEGTTTRAKTKVEFTSALYIVRPVNASVFLSI